MADRSTKSALEFRPLTSERWPELEKLFGPNGACGGCWCMWWRLTAAQFQEHKGPGNRDALKRIVESGEVPGIIAYSQGEPVGWCSVAPRQAYPRLERSRTLKRVDDKPVWSVVCFFVAKPWRRKGVTEALLKAAQEYAARYGARLVEAYPVEPGGKAIPDAFAYTGLASTFRRAGFDEVLRRSPTRPIMRKSL